MKRHPMFSVFRLVFVLLFFGCWWMAGCQRPALQNASQAVINGTPDLRYPGVGVLVRDRVPFCTATLITSRLVLTAGHCIDLAKIAAKGGNTVEFRVDTPLSNDPGNYKSHYFASEHRLLNTHPRWNPERLLQGFDVGLVVLKKEVPKTTATPIAVRTKPIPQVSKLLFLGYGLIHSLRHPVSPNRKMGAEIAISRIERDRITSYSQGISICHGDSGGPALLIEKGSVEVVAVNSYGQTQGVPNSRPLRSRCDASAVSIRTDSVTNYLLFWKQKLGGDGQTCVKDSDCGGCQTCNQGVCQTQYPQRSSRYCKACKTDVDCGAGHKCHRVRGASRCVPRCTDGCCPSGLLCLPDGKAGLCEPSSCPELACQKDDDCGSGERCQNNKCQLKTSSRSPSLCNVCKTHKECGQGALCYGRQVGGKCLQPCDTGGVCPTGFRCQNVRPGFPRQCMPTGSYCEVQCSDAKPCPSDFECKNNRCKRKNGGDVGDSCEQLTCQPGLWCVKTLQGKRCLQACHISMGFPGGACRGDDFCTPGSRCLAIRGLKRKFCFAECKTNADCANGGDCVSGYCYCGSDQDCKTGYKCEKGFGNSSSGFCVNPRQIRACPSGFQCQFHVSGSFCFPSNTREERSVGQACDQQAGCHQGLNCLELRNHAGVCTENCRSDGICSLGGTCYQGACLCTVDKDCPKGRSCQLFAFFAGQARGICTPPVTTSSDVPCVSDEECGSGWRCEAGRCIEKKPQEPVEPPVEEVVSDADSSVVDEPVTPDEPVREVVREMVREKQERAKEEKRAQKELPGDSGCQCQFAGTPSYPWELLCLFLMALWIRKRRY